MQPVTLSPSLVTESSPTASLFIDGKNSFFHDSLPTPLGTLQLLADEQFRLRLLTWNPDTLNATGAVTLPDPGGLTSALRRYFEGDLTAIDSLPAYAPGTAFQQTVWRALREIPCGTTISYGELARRVGKPTGARAVGLANGSNPIAIVVPCHRVIGARQSLTGYAGGLERKAWLLRHEGALLL